MLIAHCPIFVKISADSRRAFGENVAAALAARIRATVEQISREPMGVPELEQRSGAHVVTLVRYPYKIFYRVFEDRVRIQHVRHTARRSWEGSEYLKNKPQEMYEKGEGQKAQTPSTASGI